MSTKEPYVVLKYIVVAILLIAIVAVFWWIISDMIHCAQIGGVFVKGIPWYTCIGGDNG